jgi:putative sigma-54 modulation protein
VEIDIRARNAPITDAIREQASSVFEKVERQVSPYAQLHLELIRESNPHNPVPEIAEATLHLKGTVLRARDESPDMMHSLANVADKLSRQVKRYTEKRRGPRH